MRRRLSSLSSLRLLAVSLLAATGLAGVSAAPAPVSASAACVNTLNVVAHQDDDLLFINPAISDDIAAGKCLTTVFVTAGDAGRGAGYWRGRERGAMAAYARMAGVAGEWEQDTVTVNRRSVHRATLTGAPITLLFLRLPDRVGGWPLQTVQQLWLNPAASIRALETGQSFTRAVVLGLLTEVMTVTQPTQIRTLDFHGTYGDGDHDDHHAAAYFTYAAQRRYTTEHTVTGYLGYGVADRPANLTAEQHDAKLDAFLAYAPYDFHVCDTAEKCDAGIYRDYFTHTVPVEAPRGPGHNRAGWATTTASSQHTASAQTASKVADGRLGSARIGEWATRGGRAGSWVALRWADSQRLDRITLHDRVNLTDQVLAGELTFSDGTSVRVGALPNNGAPLTVVFTARDVTGVRFTITKVSARTRNAGLAEIGAITAA